MILKNGIEPREKSRSSGLIFDLNGDEAEAPENPVVERQEAVEVTVAIVAQSLDLIGGRDVVAGEFIQSEVLAGMVKGVRDISQGFADILNELLQLRE